MDRVIEVIKVLGKCGLSYRGTEFEAAYTWEKFAVDHGNFLEMIILLRKFDVSLQEHVRECVKKNKRKPTWQGCKRQRTSVNNTIDVISLIIKESLSREVSGRDVFCADWHPAGCYLHRPVCCTPQIGQWWSSGEAHRCGSMWVINCRVFCGAT